MFPLPGQHAVRKAVEVRYTNAAKMYRQILEGGFQYIRIRWPQHNLAWAIFRMRTPPVLHRDGFYASYNTGFYVDVKQGAQALYIFLDPVPIRISHEPTQFYKLKEVLSITSDEDKLLKHRTGIVVGK